MIFYNGIPKEKVIEAYRYAVNLRKNNKKLGQRSIQRKIKENLGIEIIEGTLSGWIYRKIVPFAQEKTQFKPKPIPPKVELHEGYAKNKISAQRLAKKYKVSTIILINWLRHYNLPVRTHRESMNTPLIKEELRKLKLIYPTKDYKILTPEKSYILGVLCGDGFIGENSIRMEIRRDVEFIDKFTKAIKSVYGIECKCHYYKPRNSYVIQINNKIIAQDLGTYGKFKSFEWYIPKEILDSENREIIINFLKGVYDSDGYIVRYNVGLTCASKKGVEGIKYLLAKLGIDSKLYKSRKYFVVRIGKKQNLRKFRDLINFTIKRKNKKFGNIYRLGW